jgi:hypothetical protein
VKTFGKARKLPAERIPFSFIVHRDDEPEEHHFLARKVEDFTALAMAAINSTKHPERSVGGMFAFIAKILDNTDGVPAGWEPTELEPPAPPVEPRPWSGSPTDDGPMVGDLRAPGVLESEAKYVPSFRAPTRLPEEHPLAQYAGGIVPMTQATRFERFEHGSSRRRWLALVSEESEVDIKADELAALFEWMASVAAERPTQPSS